MLKLDLATVAHPGIIYTYEKSARLAFILFLLTARVALTVSRGGSYAQMLLRLVRLVLDPWRYQVAKSAFSGGPDLGSFSPHQSSCLCHRCSYLPECELDALGAITALRQPRPRWDLSHLDMELVGFSPGIICQRSAGPVTPV